MTMFVVSVGLVYLKPNFIIKGLVYTDIWALVSHDA